MPRLTNHWLRLILEGNGTTTNTSAIGAQITLTAGGKVQTRRNMSPAPAAT
jgi:hypothetical protein